MCNAGWIHQCTLGSVTMAWRTRRAWNGTPAARALTWLMWFSSTAPTDSCDAVSEYTLPVPDAPPAAAAAGLRSGPASLGAPRSVALLTVRHTECGRA